MASIRTKRTPWRQRLAVLTLCSVSAVSTAWAQAPQDAQRDLATTLAPGMTVWLTDRSGHEEKSQIVGVSGDLVTTRADADIRHLRTSDVMRVRVRQADSLWNGALIGAAAAVAPGLLLCRLTEPWETCRGDVEGMLRFGVIGAGIGMGIDALIRGRRTIYEATPGPVRVSASPLLGRHAGGVRVSLSF